MAYRNDQHMHAHACTHTAMGVPCSEAVEKRRTVRVASGMLAESAQTGFVLNALTKLVFAASLHNLTGLVRPSLGLNPTTGIQGHRLAQVGLGRCHGRYICIPNQTSRKRNTFSFASVLLAHACARRKWCGNMRAWRNTQAQSAQGHMRHTTHSHESSKHKTAAAPEATQKRSDPSRLNGASPRGIATPLIRAASVANDVVLGTARGANPSSDSAPVVESPLDVRRIRGLGTGLTCPVSGSGNARPKVFSKLLAR